MLLGAMVRCMEPPLAPLSPVARLISSARQASGEAPAPASGEAAAFMGWAPFLSAQGRAPHWVALPRGERQSILNSSPGTLGNARRDPASTVKHYLTTLYCRAPYRSFRWVV